jgi:hypothetical protein
MVHINEVTFYANVKGEHGREIREARITEMIVRPCYLQFSPHTQRLLAISGCGFSFNIEVAGIGEISSYEFSKDIDGKLYLKMDDARTNNEHRVYNEYSNYSVFDMRSFSIYLSSLNLDNSYFSFDEVMGYDYCTPYIKLLPIAYSWTGTCAQRNEIAWKCRIDLINNKVRCYVKGVCEYEDKLGKLYPTKALCEQDNEIQVITFPKKEVQKTKKVVTFQVTTTVEVEVDTDDETIVEMAAVKIKNESKKNICETCTSIK